MYVDVLEIDVISQRGDDASALVRTVETGTSATAKLMDCPN